MTVQELYNVHVAYLLEKGTNYIPPQFQYVRRKLLRLKLTQQDREDIKAGYPPTRMTVNVYDERTKATGDFRIHKYPYQQRIFLTLAAEGYLSRQECKKLLVSFFPKANSPIEKVSC